MLIQIRQAAFRVELTTPDGTLVASVTTPSQPSVAQQVLRISEIMYHPADPPTGSLFDDNDFEFVELINISETETVNLEQVAFTQGIQFQFGGEMLAPVERTIIVHNQDAFQTRYGTKVRVAGQFQGSLNNARERLKLEDASRNTILDFVYADGDPWPERADGIGASLELIDAATTPVNQLDKYCRWRGSIDFGGSPAGTDSSPPGVFINEVLTNVERAAGLSDSIELSNASRSAAFRTHYGVGETTILVGGYRGRLGNGGQAIQLQRPGESAADEPSLIPRRLEDEVLYDDLSPWPTETDGAGSSLSRRTIFGSGNAASSWRPEKPTPGTTDLFRPVAGDSNLDRVFNQLDIVITLQGGKYLTGSPASFVQGDWNQDGLFNQFDVVAALSAGNYL